MQKGRDYKILKTLPDFEFLEGENLYVANVCHGTLEGLKITAFDFHRETSIENQGRQQSRHIYNACFMTPCLAQDQILKNWSEEQDCPRHELLNADFTQSLDHGPDIYIEVRDDQLLMAIQGRIMPDQLIANLDLLQKIVARVNPVAV